MNVNLRSSVIFFFTALTIAFMVEFLFRLVATDNPKALGFALIFYPIFIIFAMIIGKAVIDKTGKTAKYVIYYFILGFMGLIVFEWILVGNSPWGNPNANQIAMFSYWALLGFIPRILSENNHHTIKKLIVFHLVAYFMISLIGGLASSEGFSRFVWIIWTFTISFPLMNIHAILFMIRNPKVTV